MSENKLRTKLLTIQSELKANRSRWSSYGEYWYRSCEDVLTALKPHLNEHHILMKIEDDIEVKGDRYYIKATVTLTDIESGEIESCSAYAREALNKTKMDESQLTGAASSYARKYALNGMFLIDDNKDADTDEMNQEVETTTMHEVAELVGMVYTRRQEIKDAFGINVLEDKEYSKWLLERESNGVIITTQDPSKLDVEQLKLLVKAYNTIKRRENEKKINENNDKVVQEQTGGEPF